TDLLRVCDCVEIVRRERWLTAGEENDDLSSRFKGYGAIENRFCVFKRRLVNIANLVRVHEARIAHNVAAIRQVDSQHRAASKLDIRSAVTMNIFVFSSLKVATKEERLDPLEKRGISRHHIFKLPVLRTSLSHHDVTVSLDDLRFDLT